MFILVVNAGSSSLKYQLFEMTKEEVLAKGLCERIGIDGKITHTNLQTGEKFSKEVAMPTHNEATRAMIDALLDAQYGVIKDMSDISAIGHRVVQGGPWITKPTLVTDEAIEDLKKCVVLAPLHTPPHLQGIEGCKAVMPNTPMVLVIDTSFHATIPEYASTFPIDINVSRKHHIKRYGAHGTSHRYVAQECAKWLDKPVEETKIVTCHLGNGSSISAVKGGKVVDTSMGFTPLDGIIMGSRCGAIDPAVVPYVMEKENIPVDKIGDWMNKKCGLLGVSGVSSDLRDVHAAIAEGNKDAKLAFDILVYEIKKFVGAYAAAMNGVDAVVFTAGIGENDHEVRFHSLKDMEYLGIKVDAEKNLSVRSLPAPCDISADGSAVRVFVIPTNEELVIARDTKEVLDSLK
ncbi:MAG: acetate kinase [Ruminococcaceae bacterium]|nr:acetate kinase [Oscillospiraceae bacterium]